MSWYHEHEGWTPLPEGDDTETLIRTATRPIRRQWQVGDLVGVSSRPLPLLNGDAPPQGVRLSLLDIDVERFVFGVLNPTPTIPFFVLDGTNERSRLLASSLNLTGSDRERVVNTLRRDPPLGGCPPLLPSSRVCESGDAEGVAAVLPGIHIQDREKRLEFLTPLAERTGSALFTAAGLLGGNVTLYRYPLPFYPAPTGPSGDGGDSEHPVRFDLLRIEDGRFQPTRVYLVVVEVRQLCGSTWQQIRRKSKIEIRSHFFIDWTMDRLRHINRTLGLDLTRDQVGAYLSFAYTCLPRWPNLLTVDDQTRELSIPPPQQNVHVTPMPQDEEPQWYAVQPALPSVSSPSEGLDAPTGCVHVSRNGEIRHVAPVNLAGPRSHPSRTLRRHRHTTLRNQEVDTFNWPGTYLAEKISDGETQLDLGGRDVIGPLQLAGEYPKRLAIRNAHFRGPVDASEAHFHKSVSFVDCTFDHAVDLHGAVFGGGLTLDRVRIHAKGAPDQAWPVLDLRNSTCEGPLSIHELSIEQGAFALDGTEFNAAVTLEDIDTGGPLTARYAQFGDALHLDRITLSADRGRSRLDMQEATFDRSITAHRVHASVVVLSGIHVKGNLAFKPHPVVPDGDAPKPALSADRVDLCRARVEGNLILEAVEVSYDVLLEQARIGGHLIAPKIQVCATPLSLPAHLDARTDVKGSVGETGGMFADGIHVAGKWNLSEGILGRLIARSARIVAIMSGVRVRVRGNVNLSHSHAGNIDFNGIHIGPVSGSDEPDIRAALDDNAMEGPTPEDLPLLNLQLCTIDQFFTMNPVSASPSGGSVHGETAASADVEATDPATVGAVNPLLTSDTGLDVARPYVRGSVDMQAAKVGRQVQMYGVAITGDLNVSRSTLDEVHLRPFVVFNPEPDPVSYPTSCRRLLLINAHIRTALRAEGVHIQDLSSSSEEGLSPPRDPRHPVDATRLVVDGDATFSTAAEDFRCDQVRLSHSPSRHLSFTYQPLTDEDITIKTVFGGTVCFRQGAIRGILDLSEHILWTSDLSSETASATAVSSPSASRLDLKHAQIAQLKLSSNQDSTRHPQSLELEGTSIGHWMVYGGEETALSQANALTKLLARNPFNRASYQQVESFFRNRGEERAATLIYTTMQDRARDEMRITHRDAFKRSQWMEFGKTSLLLVRHNLHDVLVRYGTTSLRCGAVILGLFLTSLFLFDIDLVPALQYHIPPLSPIGLSSPPLPEGEWMEIWVVVMQIVNWILWPIFLLGFSGLMRTRS